MTVTTHPLDASDDVLAAEVKSGNPVAALALFDRYAGFVHNLCGKYGNFVAFDREDVSQTVFISLLIAAVDAIESGEDFTRVFHNRAIQDLKDESARQRFPVPLPYHTFVTVYRAVSRFDGDAAAAREWLAEEAPGQRVTRETFDAVWLIAFGVHLEWSSHPNHSNYGAVTHATSYAEMVGDPAAHDAFSTIEDRDAVERMLGMLTNVEREVIERTYGLNGHEPQTSPVIGTVLGMFPDSVRRIHTRVIAKLQIHAEDY